MKPAEVKKVTPILFAKALEPCIQFWSECLGFQKTIEVPEGDKVGFVILEKNGIELMYQSFASVAKDNAATGEAVRTTFYHSREFGIKEPSGHYLIFAQQGAAPEE
jgi:uncharacterized glyoxalase superfamily protein PhnB